MSIAESDIKPMKTQKYYQITAEIDGNTEILFGSFDKSDCTYSLECDKDGWKEEGYKKIKLVTTITEEQPDPEVYGEWATEKPKEEIQAIYTANVEGLEMTYEGEPIDSTIHSIESEDMGATVRVVFEDEYMADVIAGNISSRVYDCIESALMALRYSIEETDGCELTLTRN